jgi:hypothetical protein
MKTKIEILEIIAVKFDILKKNNNNNK